MRRKGICMYRGATAGEGEAMTITMCKPCKAKLGRTKFNVGDKVRCHADCGATKGSGMPFDGVISEDRGTGWYRVTRESSGFTFVHAQELELLDP